MDRIHNTARPHFVNTHAQNWQNAIPWMNIAANNCSPKGILVRLHVAPTLNLAIGELGNLFDFWEISIVLLNLGSNKDLELVLIHFLGLKNVRHLPCGFEFSRF